VGSAKVKSWAMLALADSLLSDVFWCFLVLITVVELTKVIKLDAFSTGEMLVPSRFSVLASFGMFGSLISEERSGKVQDDNVVFFMLLGSWWFVVIRGGRGLP